MEPFTCSCGIKTREPFIINGIKMCTVCAEQIAPRLVDSRTAASWKAFTDASHRIPTVPGYKKRYSEATDGNR